MKSGGGHWCKSQESEANLLTENKIFLHFDLNTTTRYAKFEDSLRGGVENLTRI